MRKGHETKGQNNSYMTALLTSLDLSLILLFSSLLFFLRLRKGTVCPWMLCSPRAMQLKSNDYMELVVTIINVELDYFFSFSPL